MIPGSPFKCGGSAVTIPIKRDGANGGKLLIRCDNDDPTNRVLFRINGLVDATHAGGYLMGNEALTIELDSISPNAEYPVTVLNTVNNPNVYWSLV